ncbi:hypothetical protein GL263_17645 [Streptomyces durbertensis]|uniref:Secreted protein n=1 Tax=Streptomyces durbertensis TaxID=2448886 RepID=A0ABR6EJ84_9ACTN|nr:hypothetical protein [Streptomyces durbertensis]MBB1245375.1 hypothetical protein [Streptomyces durbertensis]
MKRRIRVRKYSVVMGALLAVGFLFGVATPASAGTLHWKNGTSVSHSRVFDGSTSKNIDCYAPAGYNATMCIRYDRRAIYVRSDKANGYFKLGQWSAWRGGDVYRCQNNNRNSSGNGTWVECQWNWPRTGCYFMRTGYGQHEWYVVSHSNMKCY